MSATFFWLVGRQQVVQLGSELNHITQRIHFTISGEGSLAKRSELVSGILFLALGQPRASSVRPRLFDCSATCSR
jgi:hypothetical protein